MLPGRRLGCCGGTRELLERGGVGATGSAGSTAGVTGMWMGKKCEPHLARLARHPRFSHDHTPTGRLRAGGGADQAPSGAHILQPIPSPSRPSSPEIFIMGFPQTPSDWPLSFPSDGIPIQPPQTICVSFREPSPFHAIDRFQNHPLSIPFKWTAPRAQR